MIGTILGDGYLSTILLYADLDYPELDLLAQEYAGNNNILGENISNILVPQWDKLRESILEKRHDILITIKLDDYMQIPNASETFREMRVLTARATIDPQINMILTKLPPDLFETFCSFFLETTLEVLK